jgi:hypothetical protein
MLSKLHQNWICFSLRNVIQMEVKCDGHSVEESTCSCVSLNTAMIKNGAVTDLNMNATESDADSETDKEKIKIAQVCAVI